MTNSSPIFNLRGDRITEVEAKIMASPAAAKLPPLALAARRLFDLSTPLGFSITNAVSGATALPPQTILNLAAGTYHGVLLGSILFIASATFGGIFCLLLVRNMLRGALLRSSFMQQHRSRWEALDRAIMKEGAGKLVALMRLSPVIPFMPATVLLALTETPLSAFVYGSVLGLIPFTMVYAYIGSAGKQLLSGGMSNPKTLSLTLVGLVTTLALTWKISSVASKALEDAGGV